MKPTVSASGDDTALVDLGTAPQIARALADGRRRWPAMVQPFIEAVRTVGLEERHGREDAVLQRAEQARVLAHGVTSKTKHRIGKTVSFSPSMPPPTQAARLFR